MTPVSKLLPTLAVVLALAGPARAEDSPAGPGHEVIRIWPGPQHPLWAECLACYGLTAEQVATAKVSPLDRIEPVARAGIPIIGVSGDADEAVDMKKNLGVLAQRYRAAGGTIKTG